MAEKYRFFDATQDELGQYDREYNAQEFTDYFKALVTTGVMKGAGNQLAVTTNGSSMITKIDTGIAFILGKYYENDSLLELTHDTETLGKNRIDRIVIRLDMSTEARHVKAFIKKGTLSTSPTAPTLTQTNNLYEISLAQVKIVGGQTFINAIDITDERGMEIICPYAGSNILPSFDDNALSKHINDTLLHKKYIQPTHRIVSSTLVLDIIDNDLSLIEGLTLSIKMPVNQEYYMKIKLNNSSEIYVADMSNGLVAPGKLKVNTIITVIYNGSFWILQSFNVMQDTGWINLAANTGWYIDYTGDLQYKKIGEVVHVKGFIKAVSGVTKSLFTLPVGFRPKLTTPFLVYSTQNSNGVGTVDNNGSAVFTGSTPAINTIIFFSFSFPL